MKGHFSRARLRRFACSGEGAAMIEFAMVFPIMLLITFGIMETGMFMFSQVTLEAGLKQASRYGITSQTPGTFDPALLPLVPAKFKIHNDPREEQIGYILNQFTSDLINLDNADIHTKTYGSFILIRDGEPYNDSNGNGQYDTGEPFQDIACPHNGVRDGPGSGAAESIGAAGAIVVYTVTYNWKVMTPFVGPLLGHPGQGGYIIPMRASMVAKNEPSLSGSTFGC
jgi:Flp pilus assembly protein TadG